MNDRCESACKLIRKDAAASIYCPCGQFDIRSLRLRSICDKSLACPAGHIAPQAYRVQRTYREFRQEFISLRISLQTDSQWIEAYIQMLMPLSTFMKTYPPEHHVQGNMSAGFYVRGNMSTGFHVCGNMSTSWNLSLLLALRCLVYDQYS